MSGVLTKLQDLVQGLEWQDVQQFCVNNVRTILVVGVSVSAWWLLFKKPRGLPPGPTFTLPIIGDFLAMGDIPGGDIRVPIRRLRKKHGDIFSLYMGQRLAVFINGYGLIKEALVKHGDVFSDRPHLFLNDFITDMKGISNSSGQEWKDQRKFALETLREFGFGRTILEDKIQEEIALYVEIIVKHGGKPFDMCRLTQAAISNVISSLVYGQRFDYEDPVFKEFLEKVEENFASLGSTAILNFVPGLRFLPGDLFNYKRILHNIKVFEDSIVHPSINAHEAHYDENNTGDFISTVYSELSDF